MERGAHGFQLCDVYIYCSGGLQQNEGRSVIKSLHISESHSSVHRLLGLISPQFFFFFFILWTLCSNFCCISFLRGFGTRDKLPRSFGSRLGVFALAFQFPLTVTQFGFPGGSYFSFVNFVYSGCTDPVHYYMQPV